MSKNIHCTSFSLGDCEKIYPSSIDWCSSCLRVYSVNKVTVFDNAEDVVEAFGKSMACDNCEAEARDLCVCTDEVVDSRKAPDLYFNTETCEVWDNTNIGDGGL